MRASRGYPIKCELVSCGKTVLAGPYPDVNPLFTVIVEANQAQPGGAALWVGEVHHLCSAQCLVAFALDLASKVKT